jgi:hypothetical protein
MPVPLGLAVVVIPRLDIDLGSAHGTFPPRGFDMKRLMQTLCAVEMACKSAVLETLVFCGRVTGWRA